MSTSDHSIPELPTRYDAHAAEAKYYDWWERQGYFTPDVNAPGEPYCIVIPPPNITGILHMGHALNSTLQDVLIRWKRMAGFNTLWVPGTDHASIATQYVVEKMLRESGMERPRETLGRDKFLEKVWEWKEKHGSIITGQLRRLGASADWTRERFTMDEGLSRSVRLVFARLYKEGLIYRGNYLINWCPRCQTTLADDEVEYEDKNGKLWHLKYPIEGMPGRFAVVATSRPETMLGDTAVAVNPKDERYADLIGKFCRLPLVNRRIPIIADDFVDREFGTGMVKITPAHDPNDYQAGKRHNLEEINVLTPDAHINENGGEYAGLDRYAARKRIVADLEAQGLLEKTDDHPQRISTCYRCNTVIEPYLSLQWFVKIAPLADKARNAVETGAVRFRPEARKNDLFHWLDNIRDWCISRQLWWGHQIPAFYDATGNIIVAEDDEQYEQLRARAASGELRQDDDVLDTWFSSALWPFSTLGWPDETDELKTYYPTATLSTGKDIIFLWVARMIMMGLHFRGEVPFHTVFFHPIVADEHGKKMSKSKGNALDPLDLIKDYGTDALRLALAGYSGREQQIAFSVKELEGYRNFMNKVWNASRLILSNLSDLRPQTIAATGPMAAAGRSELALEDRWILSRYATTVIQVNESLEAYDFDVAVKAFREFFWNDFCDYYLELIKPRLYNNPNDLSADPADIKSRTQAQGILFVILEGSMRLLHPFCPYITEEIWQVLRTMRGEDVGFNSPSAPMSTKVAPYPVSPSTDAVLDGVINHGADDSEAYLGRMTSTALDATSIMVAPWNAFGFGTLADEAAEREVSLLQEVLYSIRNIRGEMRIPPGTAARVLLLTSDGGVRTLLERNSGFFTSLTNLKSLQITDAAEAPPFAATAVAGGVTIYVELPEELRAQEAQRLAREVERLRGERARLAGKLGNEAFVSKAPPSVIEKEKAKLAQIDAETSQLQAKLESLEA